MSSTSNICHRHCSKTAWWPSFDAHLRRGMRNLRSEQSLQPTLCCLLAFRAFRASNDASQVNQTAPIHQKVSGPLPLSCHYHVKLIRQPESASQPPFANVTTLRQQQQQKKTC